MKTNDKLKSLKITPFWILLACSVLVACDKEQNKESVPQEQAKVLIMRHDKKSLEEYKGRVEAYREAQGKLNDSVNKSKNVQEPKVYKER